MVGEFPESMVRGVEGVDKFVGVGRVALRESQSG